MRQATLELQLLAIRLTKGLISGWERWLRAVVDADIKEEKDGGVKNAANQR